MDMISSFVLCYSCFIILSQYNYFLSFWTSVVVTVGDTGVPFFIGLLGVVLGAN